MNIEGALAYLDAHVNLETSTSRRAAARRLDRMRDLVGLMGDPQASYPVIHLTGTNGKGSTARMLTALLVEKGLSVGTYTSPHLERINERMAWNGDPIDNASFVEVIEAVAQLEDLLDSPPTHFEIITAAAYRWFADIAVDVAVVEVGLGGRWDATNVADGQVAAVTNVSLDHAEVIGPTLADIAEEKAGIVKPGSVVVMGETEPELVEIFAKAAFAASAESVWLRGRDFDCTANDLAHGGRHIELVTPGARYPGLFLPVHGAYQGENAAMALAAAEAFFGAPLDPDVVADALASGAAAGPAGGRQPRPAAHPRRRPQPGRRGPVDGRHRGGLRRPGRPHPGGGDAGGPRPGGDAGGVRRGVGPAGGHLPAPVAPGHAGGRGGGRGHGPGDRRGGGGVGAGGGGHRPRPGQPRRAGGRHRLPLRGGRGPGRPHRLGRLRLRSGEVVGRDSPSR